MKKQIMCDQCKFENNSKFFIVGGHDYNGVGVQQQFENIADASVYLQKLIHQYPRISFRKESRLIY